MRFQPYQWIAKLNPNRSLKAKIGLITMGTVLLLSIVLGLLAGNISRSRISDSRGEFLASLAFQMADKVRSQYV